MYWEIANRLRSLLNSEKRLEKKISEEFLLIMGKSEEIVTRDPEGFVIYIYTPAFAVKRFRP
jgi:hypothetical protein